MRDFLARIDVNWAQTLSLVLEQARAAGTRGLVVFDLDSTVFDNRPRQARIVREYGAAHGLSALLKCQPWHFFTGWDLEPAALACGLSAEEYRPHQKPLKAFWASRFFTSEYCVDDIEVVGAPRYVHAVAQTGARVFYVTGRHEPMRAGTVACLQRCAMPVPDGAKVQLLMKPTLQQSDDEYKRETHAALKGHGQLVAVFDNEPTHINDYAHTFPGALPVHLATDHSGRTNHLEARVVSIPHFAW